MPTRSLLNEMTAGTEYRQQARTESSVNKGGLDRADFLKHSVLVAYRILERVSLEEHAHSMRVRGGVPYVDPDKVRVDWGIHGYDHWLIEMYRKNPSGVINWLSGQDVSSGEIPSMPLETFHMLVGIAPVKHLGNDAFVDFNELGRVQYEKRSNTT